mgnify:CR=1 FL=1
MNPPRFIQVEITCRCNARCVACGWPAEGPVITWELFERVLGAVAPDCLGSLFGLGAVTADCLVSLFGPGEPLLHPLLLDMVRSVAERGAQSQISTNGILLTPECSQSLKEAGLTKAIVSIWGATKELHERLQPGVDSDAVWANLAACVKAGIATELAFVPMRSNLHETEAVIARAQECNIKTVRLIRLIVPLSRPEVAEENPFTPDLLEKNAAALHQVIDAARATGMEVIDLVGV